MKMESQSQANSLLLNPVPVHVDVLVEDEVTRRAGVLLDSPFRRLVVNLPDVTVQQVDLLERLSALGHNSIETLWLEFWLEIPTIIKCSKIGRIKTEFQSIFKPKLKSKIFY